MDITSTTTMATTYKAYDVTAHGLWKSIADKGRASQIDRRASQVVT